MPAKPGLYSKYKTSCLIETGSYFGDGIQSILNEGFFDKVISTEISDKYYRHCFNRSFQDARVSINQNYLYNLEDGEVEKDILAAYISR